MAPCRRRYSARRFKALAHDPQLLVIRPAPTTTSLDHLKPFKLSTALMAVHKDCYAPIGLIQQGGPRRRETRILANFGKIAPGGRDFFVCRWCAISDRVFASRRGLDKL